MTDVYIDEIGNGWTVKISGCQLKQFKNSFREVLDYLETELDEIMVKERNASKKR